MPGTRASVPGTRASETKEGSARRSVRCRPETRASGTMVGGGGGVAPWARGALGGRAIDGGGRERRLEVMAGRSGARRVKLGQRRRGGWRRKTTVCLNIRGDL